MISSFFLQCSFPLWLIILKTLPRGDPPALHKSKFPSRRSCSVRHTGGVDGGLTAQALAYRVIDRLIHRASLLFEFPPQSNDYSIMLPLAHASSIPMFI